MLNDLSLDRPKRVIVIGGGLAGLAAAIELKRRGIDYLLIEASSSLGGKLKSEIVDGRTLDVGFQVLLGAYPKLGKYVQANKETLELKAFAAGAIVCKNNRSHPLLDPMAGADALATAVKFPLISWSDKLLTAKLRAELKIRSYADILGDERTAKISTETFLRRYGFSRKYLDSFAAPFFGGVFGTRNLNSRANLFCYCFKSFGEGEVYAPTAGVSTLPRLLAKELDSNKIVCSCPAKQINLSEGRVTCSNGQQFEGKAIIIATEAEHAASLLQLCIDPLERMTYHCIYFASQVSLYKEKLLFLNANSEGLINNGVQFSNLCISRQARSENLISVTILGDPQLSTDELINHCADDLNKLFKHVSDSDLQPLKHYRISGSKSLLRQTPDDGENSKNFVFKLQCNAPPNIFFAGEYILGFSSQESAYSSGIAAAECASRYLLKI